MFIRDVTADSKDGYNNATDTFNETLVFLGAFSDVCYSHVTGLLRDTRVHHALARDIESSLYLLNKTLAAHREAWRYVSLASKTDGGQRDPDGMHMPSNASLEVKYERKRWRDEMKERSQLWRERARPGLYGTLFGREEMDILIASCENWMHRLRQTLEIIFLTIGPPSPEYRRSRQAATLAVDDILGRQHRASATPSGDYNALQGRLREASSTLPSSSGLIKTIYIDGDEEIDVLVEPRSDNETPTEFMCHLTWLLQAPIRSDPFISRCRYRLHTLSCLGFIDDPFNTRSLILYRAPQSHPFASSPPSLHDLISKGPAAKMSLGARYSAARDLAATLLETHASGWVHGNIQSRSIAMLPRELNDLEPAPYFVGWGVLQPLEASSFLLEPNLYRHHDRFGRPSVEYANEHDIYSLGIVLLELGLWQTMANIFARRLEKSPRFGIVQQGDLFLKIHNQTLDWANSIEIEREMGKTYAQIVLKCLTWHQLDPVDGMLDFRKQVVDTLADGCML